MDGKLNDFLGFFKKIVFTADDQKSNVVRIIKQVAHVELPEEAIVINKNSVHFKVSQTIKSHLFIKRDEILSCFKKEKLEIVTIQW